MWAVYSGEVRGEDGHCQGPKHVVVLYVVNSIHISTIKVVIDKYIHSNLVYLWTQRGMTKLMILFHYFCSNPYVSTFLNLGSKALFNNFLLSHTPFTQPLTLRPICTVHLNNETLGCVCVNMQRSLDSECSRVRWEKEGSLVEVVPPPSIALLFVRYSGSTCEKWYKSQLDVPSVFSNKLGENDEWIEIN